MIDVHAHLFFDDLLGRAGACGPTVTSRPGGHELVTGSHRWAMGASSSLETSPQRRLDELALAGIDRQVLSLSPLWFFHHSPADIAVDFIRRANDLMADFCEADRTRLFGLAALPVQDVGAAIAELERSTAERGLAGAYIGTDARQGLDDPDLDDLYAACVELNVTLVLHSTVAGVDGPPGDQRLERWLGQVTIGYPIEETLAVQAVLLGGVLTRHPGLDILLPHGGGAFPFLHGRLRSWVEASPAAPVSVTEFDEAVGRLWFDTHVHSHDSLTLLRAVVEPDRLVFGSNFGGWDSGPINEVAEMSESLNKNDTRLFRLDD